MLTFVNALRQIVKSDKGATMVEYGLMLALIAAVCIAAVTLIGSNASELFQNLATTLDQP